MQIQLNVTDLKNMSIKTWSILSLYDKSTIVLSSSNFLPGSNIYTQASGGLHELENVTVFLL